MATRSSILAWTIPWTEEPGRLQSIGLHTVKHTYFSYSLPIFPFLLSIKLRKLLLSKEFSSELLCILFFFFQFAGDFLTLNVTSVDSKQAYFQFLTLILVVILENINEQRGSK